MKERAAIVYFAKDSDKPYLATMTKIGKQYGSFINCVWYKVED